jgi:hypothetical protein
MGTSATEGAMSFTIHPRQPARAKQLLAQGVSPGFTAQTFSGREPRLRGERARGAGSGRRRAANMTWDIPHPPAAANLWIQRLSRTGSGENLQSKEFSRKIFRTKNLPPKAGRCLDWNLAFYFYDSKLKSYSVTVEARNVLRGIFLRRTWLSAAPPS